MRHSAEMRLVRKKQVTTRLKKNLKSDTKSETPETIIMKLTKEQREYIQHIHKYGPNQSGMGMFIRILNKNSYNDFDRRWLNENMEEHTKGTRYEKTWIEVKPLSISGVYMPYIDGNMCSFQTRKIRTEIEEMADKGMKFPVPDKYYIGITPGGKAKISLKKDR